MKNTKILEMIHAGKIEELTDLLKEEIYTEELLQIDGVTEIKFDLDGFWSDIYQVIILTKYDIPVSLNNYYEIRKSIINQIVEIAEGNFLKRTEDAIEDYGEHFYFVFECMKEWKVMKR